VYSSLQKLCHTVIGNSHAIWDHTVLPATQQRWESRLYPQLKQVLDLATQEGCKAESTYVMWKRTGRELNHDLPVASPIQCPSTAPSQHHASPYGLCCLYGLVTWHVCWWRLAWLCCSGQVLREWGFTWEMRWGFQLQTMSSEPVAKKRKLSATPASSLNVNMGISVDYGATSGPFDSPLQCVTEARRHVLDSTEHQHARNTSWLSVLPTQQPTLAPPAQLSLADSNYDSFDDCLRAAEHMDAVLSYYYADEKESGAMKVVEIFPLHHHHYHPSVPDGAHATAPDHPRCSSTNTNNAVWSV